MLPNLTGQLILTAGDHSHGGSFFNKCLPSIIRVGNPFCGVHTFCTLQRVPPQERWEVDHNGRLSGPLSQLMGVFIRFPV